MVQASDALLEQSVGFDTVCARDVPREDTAASLIGDVRIEVYEDLAKIAEEWREFEQRADGTVFQTWEWLSVWQHHIGRHDGVRPAIVAVRSASGALLCLMPFAVRRSRMVRELSWLGSQLCDYNAPLLAPEFSSSIAARNVSALVSRIFSQLQSHPGLGFDIVRLEKMPERVGPQANPLLSLAVTPHPSAAYMTALGRDWETFYRNKRSSSTRQRDRSKRQKLGRYGEVRFVTPDEDDAIVHTLDTLMMQKGRWFAQMGVGDLFAQPGHREFYRAIATEPCSRNFVHVSQLDVGSEIGAANVGLVFRGRYYHLLASYSDAEMSRFAPGVAHLHELMQWALQHGCELFDFTIGDERYKRDWCEIELKLYDHVSGATPMGAVLAPAMRAATKTKRWIKQNPKAWAVASWLRRTVSSLRRSRPGD